MRSRSAQPMHSASDHRGRCSSLRRLRARGPRDPAREAKRGAKQAWGPTGARRPRRRRERDVIARSACTTTRPRSVNFTAFPKRRPPRHCTLRADLRSRRGRARARWERISRAARRWSGDMRAPRPTWPATHMVRTAKRLEPCPASGACDLDHGCARMPCCNEKRPTLADGPLFARTGATGSGPAAQRDQWNWLSSVDSLSASVEALPPAITCATWSK